MQSLLGLLVFTCQVMPMGRVFCRQLSLSTKGVVRLEHHVRLTGSLRVDILVWHDFLGLYNGHTCCQSEEVSNLDVELFMDAASTKGFGAVLGSEWCAEPWPLSWSESDLIQNMTFLELFPIIVAMELWGDRLRYRRVRFWTDNMGWWVALTP